jgi:4-hydroxy-tetrahydrodipicolinate synthase
VGSLAGVFAAVATPLDDHLAPDVGRLLGHGRRLLAHGCDGLAVLGTTGEANGFSVDERLRLLEALGASGIPGEKLLPGTGCCAVPDTIRLTKAALAIGAAGVLVLPPFYYKSVSDDGLFAAYAQVIEGVGDSRLRLYLYHFPQMAGVGLSEALIGRLLERYPGTVVGLKDSSGDLANMTRLAQAFPQLAVFSGSDELLLDLLAAGGAGCITAVCNIASPLAARVFQAHRRGDAEAAHAPQVRLTAVRRAIQAYPQIAALKAALARITGDEGWLRLRPPLVALNRDEGDRLGRDLERLGVVPALAP